MINRQQSLLSLIRGLMLGFASSTNLKVRHRDSTLFCRKEYEEFGSFRTMTLDAQLSNKSHCNQHRKL